MRKHDIAIYHLKFFLGKVLAYVKPISTTKAAFPSFDVLFSLDVVNVVVDVGGGGDVVVVVAVVDVVVVVVVAVVVEWFCSSSSSFSFVFFLLFNRFAHSAGLSEG